jgi:hypothetical protein
VKLHKGFYLLAVIAVMLYGCKKDSPPKVTEADLAALKAYCYFLPGTYWIYEDNRGNTDSMYVTGSISGYDTTREHYYFICWIHSAYDTYDYKIEWNTSWTTYKPTRHKVFMTKLKPGDYVGQIFLMEYPFVEGNKLYWDNSNTITTKMYYNSIEINHNKFYSVVEVNESRDVTNAYFQQTNYYIAKNVGIIQEELIDSSNVWTLVRYNVVQ